LGVLLIRSFLAQNLMPEIPYSEFQLLLSQNRHLVVGPNSITGKYREISSGMPDTFITYRVVPALAQ
jgi:hypothetical protein